MDQNDKFGWILNPAGTPVIAAALGSFGEGCPCFFLAEKVKLIVRLAAALCHSKSTLISRRCNGPAVE